VLLYNLLDLKRTTWEGFDFRAVAEAATGLALLILPSLVAQLSLGEELTDVAAPGPGGMIEKSA